MNKSGQITIEMNGEPVRLMFGMTALPIIFEKIGNKQPGETYSIKECACIINAGYINSCEARDVDPTLTFEDFYLYVEAMFVSKQVEEMHKISDCFGNSIAMDYYKNMAIAEEEKEEKKSPNQSTGKKLKSSVTAS